VPCLAGIALYDLMQWHVDTGGRPIALLDRGWCRRCRAGSQTSHPVEETLDTARSLMRQLGVDEGALPRLEARPLPVSAMPEAIPDPLAAQPLSRRQFFTGMTRSAARAVGALRAGAARNVSPPPRRTWGTVAADTPRSKLISHALALAAKNGRALPAGLFPAIRVSDRCRNHRVCAAICPTGALKPYEDGDGAGIRFDSFACIACGDCVRSCPEQALGLAPHGSSVPDHAPVTLTRWERRICQRCDDEFASRGDEEHCPACRKDLSLFATGVSIGSQHT
jgi:ferredoxin